MVFLWVLISEGSRNKYHKLGGLTTEIYCLVVLEAGRLRERGGSVGSFPGLRETICCSRLPPLLCLLAICGTPELTEASLPSVLSSAHGIRPVCVQISHFYKDTSHIELGFMLSISFELDYLHNDPISV